MSTSSTSTLAVDKSFSATSNNLPLSSYTTEQQKLLLSLRDYSFSYEAFLDEPETKQALLQFMKIIHCEESLMFLDHVNEYYRKRSAANKWNALQQIFITFFSGNSVHELNLPQRSREVMEQSFMDLTDKIALKTPTTNNSSNTVSNSTLQQVNIDSADLQVCEEALKKAESYILVNMKEHVFPMFLESDTFKQFVCKKSKLFLNQIGTVRNLSHSCFVESLMDMKSCEITLDQIKMIKHHVLEEKYWDCIYSKDTCFAYLSSNKYILGEEESKKGIYFAKSQVIFPYTVEQMMNIMTNTTIRLASDKNLDSIKIIGYLNKAGGDLLSSPPAKVKSSESLSSLNNSPPASPHSTHSASSDSIFSLNKLSGKTRLATVLTHEVYKLVWPVKNRYYVLAQSMVYDTTDKLYLVAKKSCEPPNYNLSEKDAIKALDIGAWIFMPVMVDGKEHCKYIELIGTDLRGSLPQFIVHKIVKTRAKNFFRETMKVIKNTKCDMHTRPPNSSGYFETLDQNGSIAL